METAPLMRACFVVREVTVRKDITLEHIQLSAITPADEKFGPDGASENNSYARFTPSATMEMSITNQALHGKIKKGQQFFVDFTIRAASGYTVTTGDEGNGGDTSGQ